MSGLVDLHWDTTHGAELGQGGVKIGPAEGADQCAAEGRASQLIELFA